MSSRKAIAQRAKAFERVVAKTWGSFRVPLSGINSRHNAGDVLLPTGVSALLECKTRVSSSHYTLWKNAVADAVKNKIDPLRTILYFKKVGTKGHVVTLDGRLFAHLIKMPEVRAVFESNRPLTVEEGEDL